MGQQAKLFQEFKSYIEQGFGKIYAEDIPKYWVLSFGDEIEEDEQMELEHVLSDANLIQTAD